MAATPKNGSPRNKAGPTQGSAVTSGQHVQASPAEWAEFKARFKLSRRQLQVAQLLYADCPAKALAPRLGCAPSTVASHRAKLYGKLNVDDRTGLVRKILEFCIARRSGGSLPPPR